MKQNKNGVTQHQIRHSVLPRQREYHPARTIVEKAAILPTNQTRLPPVELSCGQSNAGNFISYQVLFRSTPPVGPLAVAVKHRVPARAMKVSETAGSPGSAEEAKEATGHGLRAKRLRSGAISFDLLDLEGRRCIAPVGPLARLPRLS
jgi:hypothetical protein